MANKHKLIIVTGGAGFIGSALIRFLNDQGITNILVVDDLGKSEKWKNLIGKQFSQIIHKDRLFTWLEGKEAELGAIFHLGACSNTMEVDAGYLLANNVHYSQKLIEYAVKAQIRFIYASSAATYGDGKAGFSDDSSKLLDLKPLNMYGFSKHLVDLWALKEGFLDKIVGLKYFNIFGPNEDHKGAMTSALFKMVPEIKNTGVVKLFKFTKSKGEIESYADGEQSRDFLYVKEAVKMTASFLGSKETGLFNIGMGASSTWNYLAKTLFIALGIEERMEYIDMPSQLIGKYQNYTCADMKKFFQAFPNYKMEPLSQGVFDYIQNYILPGEKW